MSLVAVGRMKMVFGLIPFGIFLLSAGFYAALSLLWGSPRYHGPVSDHFDGKTFRNVQPTPMRGLGRYLWMRLTAFSDSPPWPSWIDAQAGLPPPVRVEGLRITFINHATLLIQMEGLNILTDPIWSERASPLPWAGPRRHRPAGIRFEDLPPIDIVLLSHNHYDHMDLPTLRRLVARDRPRVVAALNHRAFLSRHGISSTEMDWWQEEILSTSVRVSAVPAQHFSSRSMNDRNRALWAGYVIQGKQGGVYFAGDTGYANHFKEIGRRFPALRAALLPIGAYKPRWFMRPVHLSPEEAVQAQSDLGAQVAIPMHYGTFQLSD